MKYRIVKTVCAALSVAVLLVLAAPAHAEETSDWKSMKNESKKAKLDEMASDALSELFAKNDKAKALYDQSVGYAVFDNMKIAFGFSGGGGNGVAVPKSGDRTYMQMGTVGVGFGLGGKKYQIVFLFQDDQTMSSFVDKGWQADATASAVAGAEVQTGFSNGIAIYVLSDKGLMASADIAGTKYWKNKKLNE